MTIFKMHGFFNSNYNPTYGVDMNMDDQKYLVLWLAQFHAFNQIHFDAAFY